jgi:hypothetical protein
MPKMLADDLHLNILTYPLKRKHIVDGCQYRIDATPEHASLAFLQRSPPEIHDRPHACVFGQQSHLTEP